jgi:hypothetical protein
MLHGTFCRRKWNINHTLPFWHLTWTTSRYYSYFASIAVKYEACCQCCRFLQILMSTKNVGDLSKWLHKFTGNTYVKRILTLSFLA